MARRKRERTLSARDEFRTRSNAARQSLQRGRRRNPPRPEGTTASQDTILQPRPPAQNARAERHSPPADRRVQIGASGARPVPGDPGYARRLRRLSGIGHSAGELHRPPVVARPDSGASTCFGAPCRKPREPVGVAKASSARCGSRSTKRWIVVNARACRLAAGPCRPCQRWTTARRRRAPAARGT
jgi:hypothetical protein